MAPKLLLINPATRVSGRRVRNAAGMATMEPLALAYVAALTPPHWEVRIVDEVMEDIPAAPSSPLHPSARSFQDTLRTGAGGTRGGDWGKPDLVGLTSLSITVPRAYEIARRYRALGVPVVLGGIHATLRPDEAALYADVVFQGEAEGKWPALIRDFEAGQLRARYNGQAAVLRNLPLPRRDLYAHRYFLRLLSASRGCRYRCEFCTLWKLEGGRHRARPPEEVWEELQVADGKRPILFTDENVFTNREWALALFNGMAERGLNRPYAIQASLNIAADDEVLAALKRSGCMTVLIGFESVSEESLRQMRKGVNLKIGVARYKEKVDRLHDHGLMSSGTFIFGNDGDGPDIFERTVEFVLEAGIDVAHFGLLTPNPGTDLFDRLAREGRLLYTDFPADYARYDIRTAVFRPLKMTPEQLEAGAVWATEAVSARSVAVRRAWNTWRETGNLFFTLIAYRWNRSGLYQRVVQ